MCAAAARASARHPVSRRRSGPSVCSLESRNPRGSVAAKTRRTCKRFARFARAGAARDPLLENPTRRTVFFRASLTHNGHRARRALAAGGVRLPCCCSAPHLGARPRVGRLSHAARGHAEGDARVGEHAAAIAAAGCRREDAGGRQEDRDGAILGVFGRFLQPVPGVDTVRRYPRPPGARQLLGHFHELFHRPARRAHAVDGHHADDRRL